MCHHWTWTFKDTTLVHTCSISVILILTYLDILLCIEWLKTKPSESPERRDPNVEEKPSVVGPTWHFGMPSQAFLRWGQTMIRSANGRSMMTHAYKCTLTLHYYTLFIIILTDRTSLEISPMKNSQLPMRDEGRLAWSSCHVMIVSILLCRTSRLAPMGAGGASDRPRGSLLPHRRISHLWVAAGSFRWSRQCECQATANKPDGMKHIETWHAVLVAVRFPSSAIPRLLIW